MCPLKKRSYRMKKRAESADQTRLRITESAVELHGSLGPSQASMSAIAAHAGVRRATLYRHFRDEKALFAACSAHWMAANPLPDPARWAAIENHGERLETGLRDLYCYYRRTEGMLANVLRDEETMPVVRQIVSGFHDYLAEARKTLVKGGGAERSKQMLTALTGHAMSFPVWRSLAVEQGVSDDRCARLMSILIVAGAGEGTAGQKGKARHRRSAGQGKR
jgi:AcrR family transcriptional regulator